MGINFTSLAQVKQTPGVLSTEKILKFYPNPATTAITFEFVGEVDKSFTLQLYNFMGRKVTEIAASSQRISFSLDGYYRGVYIYQLRNKFGRIIDSGKFQVVNF